MTAADSARMTWFMSFSLLILSFGSFDSLSLEASPFEVIFRPKAKECVAGKKQNLPRMPACLPGGTSRPCLENSGPKCSESRHAAADANDPKRSTSITKMRIGRIGEPPRDRRLYDARLDVTGSTNHPDQQMFPQWVGGLQWLFAFES